VIHVGVSGEADKLYLESRANNAGYGRPDVNNARPPDTRCVEFGTLWTLKKTTVWQVRSELSRGDPRHRIWPAEARGKSPKVCSLGDTFRKLWMRSTDFRSSDVTLGVEVCTSDDAGRFLCEFIYFKSLHSQNGRALFIHVPPVGKPYSSEQVARYVPRPTQCQQRMKMKTFPHF